MSITTTIQIKVTCHDPEMTEVNINELTEFIIDTLNNEFHKDYIEFEATP